MVYWNQNVWTSTFFHIKFSLQITLFFTIPLPPSLSLSRYIYIYIYIYIYYVHIFISYYGDLLVSFFYFSDKTVFSYVFVLKTPLMAMIATFPVSPSSANIFSSVFNILVLCFRLILSVSCHIKETPMTVKIEWRKYHQDYKQKSKEKGHTHTHTHTHIYIYIYIYIYI